MVLKYKQALRGLFTTGTSLPNLLRETQEKVGGKQEIEALINIRNVSTTMRG